MVSGQAFGALGEPVSYIGMSGVGIPLELVMPAACQCVTWETADDDLSIRIPDMNVGNQD